MIENITYTSLVIAVNFDRIIMDEDMEFDSGVGTVPQQQQYQTSVQSTVPGDGRRLLLVLYVHYSGDISHNSIIIAGT